MIQGQFSSKNIVNNGDRSLTYLNGRAIAQQLENDFQAKY